MPWVEKLPSGSYRACWRDGQGRRRSRAGFVRREEAKRFAGKEEAAAHAGGPTAAVGRSPKWSQWRDDWLARRLRTDARDLGRIDKYLTPYWGEWRLNKITRDDVKAWVKVLAETPKTVSRPRNPGPDYEPPKQQPISAATVERIYQLFSGSMREAVFAGIIPATPCTLKRSERPTIAPGHERFLTRAEFDSVVDALNEPYRTAVVLLGGTGMRFGELAGLHWSRVDLDQGLIHIVETWDAVDDVIKPYPKDEEKRTVPIIDWVQPYLERRLAERGRGTSCGHRHDGGARCRSDLVVRGPKGAPLDAHNFGEGEWRVAWQQAEVGHLRLHDLRHTYASWLVQAGVSLQEVQRLLGHQSITTTQRYAHLGKSQHDRVLAALNAG